MSTVLWEGRLGPIAVLGQGRWPIGARAHLPAENRDPGCVGRGAAAQAGEAARQTQGLLGPPPHLPLGFGPDSVPVPLPAWVSLRIGP